MWNCGEMSIEIKGKKLLMNLHVVRKVRITIEK